MRTTPAKEEIVAFIKSGAPGQKSSLKVDALKRAAQDLFTAQGLNCPVSIIKVDGQTLILNRELVNQNGHADK